MLIVEGVNLTPAEIIGTAGDKWLHISINGKDYYYKVAEGNELTIEQIRDKYNRWYDKGPQTHGRLLQWLKKQMDNKLYFKEDDDSFGSVAQASVNDLNGQRYLEIEIYGKPYKFELEKGQDGATLAKKFNSMIDNGEIMEAFELILYNTKPLLSIEGCNELHKLFRKFDTQKDAITEGAEYNGQDIAKTMLLDNQIDDAKEESKKKGLYSEDDKDPNDDSVETDVDADGGEEDTDTDDSIENAEDPNGDDQSDDLAPIFNEMRPLLKDLGLRLFRVHDDDNEVFVPGKLVGDQVVFLFLDDTEGIKYIEQPEHIADVLALNTVYNKGVAEMHDALIEALANSVEYDIDYVERVEKPVEEDTIDDIDPDTVDDTVEDIDDATDEVEPEENTEEPSVPEEGEEEEENV